MGYLDEIDLNEIERITGRYLSVFLKKFQQISHYKDKGAKGSDLTIISGGVKGLYTIMESIVVADTSGNLWCACLDSNNDVVRYFTNISEEIQQKPKAIGDWLLKFPDKKLIVNDPGSDPLDEAMSAALSS